MNDCPRTPLRTAAATVLAAASLCLLALPVARAEAKWKITGHGWGHGAGLSQWGARGLANHGIGYRKILGVYYKDTTVEATDPRRIRVLLVSGSPTYYFSNAGSACGRPLNQDRTYRASLSGSDVILRKSGGKKLKNCGSLLTARSGGDGLIELPAVGTYRGDMKFGADGAAGLLTVNSVGLESYVKGVVPNEMPSSWPSKALRAQAVAARSYALATDKGHDAFDHYADTRSQVYGGVASETSKTNSAVKDTRGMVVKHDGEVAITYFFSTSGGMTENVESVWPGSSPTPYLKAAPDPYDAASPHHDWKVTYTGDEMKSLLSGLYSGDLLGIEVVETGASGRILKAKVEGSTGSTTVDGPTLQSRLGLRSTWASFERIVPSDSASRSRSRLEDWPCGLPKASGKGCSGIPWTVSPLPSPAP